MKKDVNIENLKPEVLYLLKKDGFLEPTTFLCSNEKTYIVVMENSDTFSFDEYIEHIIKATKQYKAHKAILIAETQTLEKNSTESTYQIIEITRDKIKTLSQEFFK